MARPPRSLRPPLDVPQVRAAALALVDEGGLEALTMRRLGARLGVEAPSLYHLLPGGKDALLDLLAEAAAAEIPPVETDDWRAHLCALADGWRALFDRHPAMALLFATRPPRSGSWLAQAGRSFVVLRAAGFSEADTVYAFKTLSVLVIGQALNRGLVTPTGVAPDPLDPARLDTLPAPAPVVSVLAVETGRDFDRWHTLSLDWLLTALETRLPCSSSR